MATILATHVLRSPATVWAAQPSRRAAVAKSLTQRGAACFAARAVLCSSTTGRARIHTVGRRAAMTCHAALAGTEGMPTVKIDNTSDPLATVVTIEFADVLGELLDTMAALKDLGLNIKKMSMDCTSEEAEVCSLEKVFYVTDAKTSEKVVASAQLQEMKDTIMACMMEFHPEAKEKVSKADVSVGGVVAKLGPKVDVSIPTSIKIRAGARNVRSVMDLVTADRPGLLVNVVKVLKDISVNVVSAEVDTIGPMAHDVFFLTYKGEALEPPMEELVRNSLLYYLAGDDTPNVESY